jgi:hypothetical protein
VSGDAEQMYCEHCAFRDAIFCRRYAPRPAGPHESTLHYEHATWPEVEFDDWCGEFQQRPR